MKQPSFVPKYRIIYDKIAKRIRDGSLQNGEKLPCERDLCLEFGVERVTMRHALELLAQEGLIEKKTGVGSFVKDGRRETQSFSKNILFSMRSNPNDIQHNNNAFNAMLFFLLEQYVRERGYTLLYSSVLEKEETLTELKTPNVIGVLIISYHDEKLITNTLNAGYPVVCVNHIDRRTPSILPENEKGMADAVRYLKEFGHERIGFITGASHMCNAIERLNGYRHAMMDCGLPYLPEYVFEGNWTSESGKAAAQKMLALPERPTAILTSSDKMALGAIEEIRAQGLRIPEDISIIGFDNIDIGKYCAPALTTIGTDVVQTAKVAVDTILRLAMNGMHEEDRYSIRIPTELIVRESVGPVHK